MDCILKLKNCIMKTQCSSHHNIISWNAAGLLQHYAELFNYLDTCRVKPLAICVQESHLFCKGVPTIPGFTCFDNPRLSNLGGGTTTYVNKDYNYRDCLTFVNSSESYIEGNSVFIKLDSLEFAIYNFYLPPNKNITRQMIDSIKMYDNQLILGDFNAKSVIWGSPKVDARGRLVEEFLEKNNLVCLNDGSGTYMKHCGEVSHLDLALCKGKISTMADFIVLSDSWGSDHYPLVVSIQSHCSAAPCRPPGFNYRKADWCHYKTELDKLLTGDNNKPTVNNEVVNSVNQKYQTLVTSINHAKINSIPKFKTNTNKKYTPFWTEACKLAISDRGKAEKRMKKHKTEENIINFKRCKAKVKLTIKIAKQQYWLKYSSTFQRDSNLSHVWRIIKSINGKIMNKSDPFKNLLSEQIKNNSDIANAFSISFQKTSSNENLPVGSIQNRSNTIIYELNTINNSVPDNIKCDINNLNNLFTLFELKKAIASCKMKTAAGPDNINYQLISNLSDSGVQFLLDMINLSWTSGEIPTDWKSSFVKPILKANRNPSDLSSYRPIALANTIPKIMERLVVYRISWFMAKHKLVNRNQTGFQRGHQTVDQVYRLVKEARCAIENGDMTMAILIDFSCAFDLVWIDGIIVKLMKLNFSGYILKWIKTFLEDRLYRIKLEEDFSKPYLLENGTPQGSSLSPWLFLIMVNDFPELSTFTSCALFADDSTVWRSGKNINHISHHIQLDLETISKWCTKWGFKINTNKTLGIVFTNKTKVNIPNITINNEKIEFVDNVKMLGITLDKRLNWKKHIQSLIDRCAQCINIIRLLGASSFGSTKKALLTVYRGLIRSRVDYGCFLYQDSAKSNLQLLDTLQYKSLLLCTGGLKGTSLSSLLSECGETSLEQRRFEFYLKFLTRINFSKNSPCSFVLQDLTLTQINKKVKSHEALTFNKALYDCNICNTKLVYFDNINAPWSLPLTNVDVTLLDLLKGVNNVTAKLEISGSFVCNKYKDFVCIYVDGSKLDQRSCGISINIPSLNVLESAQVSPLVSSVTVEMIAICNAIDFAESRNLQRAVIFSDCLNAISSIKQIANWPRKQQNPLLCQKIQQSLIKNSDKLYLCWIPGHIGDINQELADTCSKQQLPVEDISDSIASPCSKPTRAEVVLEESDVLHNLQGLFKKRWRQMWLENRPSEEYFRHLGFTDSVFYYNRSNRAEEKIVNRLRLQCCGLNAYLFKISVSDSSLCDTCGVTENVEHFLLHCKKHTDLKNKLNSIANSLKLPLSVNRCLGNNSLLKCIVSYALQNKITL